MSSETRDKPASRIGAWAPYALAAVMAIVLVAVTISRGGPSDATSDTLDGNS